MFDIGRREFITLLGGGAAAWPLAARAQQPVVGFLAESREVPHLIAAFKQGVAELGYVEGKNLAIEYRFVNFRLELLPEAAADLVRLNVNAIFGACRCEQRHDQHSCCRDRFGERSRGEGICQESCPPGRQCYGNVS
jgi:hypothetical protein